MLADKVRQFAASSTLQQAVLAGARSFASDPASKLFLKNDGILKLKNTALKAGPAGRSAVSGITVTVFGCTGFAGKFITQSLANIGSRVVCPHRVDELDVMCMRPMGDLGQIALVPDFNARDDDMVAELVAKSNVVVNAIGVDKETWNYKFDEVHVDIAERIAKACASAGVERLVHMSHLGVSESAKSPFLSSKAKGEAAVKAAFPDATIFRCGPMVGRDDRYFNQFAVMQRALGCMPVYDGGRNKVQPVYVNDVAEAVVASLRSDAQGITYELGGPEVFTESQVAEMVADEMREERATAYFPGFVANAILGPRDWLSARLPLHMLLTDGYLTTARAAAVEEDFVAAPGAPGFEELGLEARAVSSGPPIDHVRYFRVGGYNAGSLTQDQVEANKAATA